MHVRAWTVTFDERRRRSGETRKQFEEIKSRKHHHLKLGTRKLRRGQPIEITFLWEKCGYVHALHGQYDAKPGPELP